MGLSHLIIISDRLPMLHRFGWEGSKLKASRLAYAWFVFDRRNGVRKGWDTTQILWRDAIKQYPIREGDLFTEALAEELPLFAWKPRGSLP